VTALADAPAEPLIYDPAQASKRLGCDANGRPIKTANWLKTQARAGTIPHTRIGKTICFSEQNLVDLVAQESREVGSGGRKKRR
jgi:hypothetical protein